MKTLPKLCKLLSITILLIGINGNACFAEKQGRIVLTPNRYKCLDLLELEKLKVTNDRELAIDYHSVAGWLRGYFTAWNNHERLDGNVTKGATTYQIMAWIFSFCRAHPSEDLEDAAVEFMSTVNNRSTTKN